MSTFTEQVQPRLSSLQALYALEKMTQLRGPGTAPESSTLLLFLARIVKEAPHLKGAAALVQSTELLDFIVRNA
jgi:hypothetical protein